MKMGFLLDKKQLALSIFQRLYTVRPTVPSNIPCCHPKRRTLTACWMLIRLSLMHYSNTSMNRTLKKCDMALNGITTMISYSPRSDIPAPQRTKIRTAPHRPDPEGHPVAAAHHTACVPAYAHIPTGRGGCPTA